jgi:hypothetical protein
MVRGTIVMDGGYVCRSPLLCLSPGTAMLVRRSVVLAGVVMSMATARAMAQQPTPLVPLPADTTAVLIGRVSDSAGVAIGAAHIRLMQADSAQMATSDSGLFQFTGLSSGLILFSVRRFGYEPMTFSVQLKPGKTHRVKVMLVPSTQPLPAIAVNDTMSHWLDMFNERRAHHPGTFLTRTDFMRHDPRTSSDILRSVPGVAVGYSASGNRVVFTRTSTRRCQATMYIHGSPFSGGIDDIPVDDIEALEVYVGVSQIPPELDRGGKNLCAVINVWTRDPRKPPDPA